MRGAYHDCAHAGRGLGGAMQYLSDRGDNARCDVWGRGRLARRKDIPAAHQDSIGIGSTDIDADYTMGFHRAPTHSTSVAAARLPRKVRHKADRVKVRVG